MENNVIISIKGKQSYEDMEDETIELVTEGRLDPDGTEGYTLSYQESELTGLEGTLTTFQIEPERITLLRIGEVNSQMVFELSLIHISKKRVKRMAPAFRKAPQAHGISVSPGQPHTVIAARRLRAS